MKKFIISLFFSIAALGSMHAQSNVSEIFWEANYQYYSGLMVLYQDNTGIFVVKYFVP